MKNIERELRLFACWSVRNTLLHDGRMVWDLLTDKRSQAAIEVAEQYADGLATADELAAAWNAAGAAAWAAARDAYGVAAVVAWAARHAARDAAWAAARDAAGAAAGPAAWVARDARHAAGLGVADAWDAAGAARDAARAAQNAHLEQVLLGLGEQHEQG
ncbi:MAG: hypothetical protein ACYSR6_14875 [Planctomycetota bacterium]|jgi:hypothetical protein